MYSYLILGAGLQGFAIAYYLIKYGNANYIRFIDKDWQKPFSAIERLKLLFVGKPHITYCFQALKNLDESLLKICKEGFAVVISALPHKENLFATYSALEAGVNYCDLGFNEKTVEGQLIMSRDIAERKGISIIPNCGVAPGLAGIIAVGGAAELGADKVEIFTGSNSLEPPNNAMYMNKTFTGVMEEYNSGKTFVLEDGKLVEKPILSGLETVNLSRIWHAALLKTPFYFTAKALQKLGVQNAFEKTLRYPGHFEIMQKLKVSGWLSSINKLKIIEETLEMAKEDIFELAIFFYKKNEIRKEIRATIYPCKETGLGAIQQITAASAAVVAIMLAEGRIKPGAYVPEDVVNHHYMLEKLREMGIELSAT